MLCSRESSENFQASSSINWRTNWETQIRPIYQDLSNDDLLTRYLGGHTQNANESFNSSTVWRMAPKHLHSGLKIVEIASYLTAGK